MLGNTGQVLRQRYFDSAGAPLASGKLYSYAAGTSNAQDTYTSSTLGTANANPVILDANGEADVWLDPSLSYKFVLKTSADVTLWTVDNVIAPFSSNAVATDMIADDAVTTAKIAADAVTAAKLKSSTTTDADRAVTTDHIRDGAITSDKMASLTNGYGVSVANKSTTSTTYVDITTGAALPLTVDITTTGRPVHFSLLATDTLGGGQIKMTGTAAAMSATIAILRDSVVIQEFILALTNTNATPVFAIPPGAIWFIDEGLDAGTYTYTIQAKVGQATTTLLCSDFRLFVMEL